MYFIELAPRHFAVADEFGALPQLLLLGPLLFAIDFAYYLAVLRKIDMKAKKADTVADRNDFCLPIERQALLFQVKCDGAKRLFQLFFVGRDDKEII